MTRYSSAPEVAHIAGDLLRQRLLHLTLLCLVLVALVALAACGPADAVIEGGA